ncbi:MAG: repressor LexA [Candidatus Latescibacteria bacterium]|nr:repressor LexA [Candidatus Latescibacterota bacterium]
MSRPALTAGEKRIYQFICAYVLRHRRPPTYQEIREEFGYRHPSSIQDFLVRLRDKGYIRVPIGANRKRAIEVVETESSELASIPLEGAVAAGRLSEAISVHDFIDVPRSMLRAGAEYFALKIQGDSMIGDCILSGDIALIRRQEQAENGQTVVALVGSEATIKRYYRRERHIELQPANPAYETIRVDEGAEVRILGVLVSVIRHLEQP